MRDRNIDQLLYNIMDTIRTRPGLYLGKKSIVLFNAFLGGYETALLRHNVGEDAMDKSFALPFDGFVWFVQCRYDCQNSAKGWSSILLEHCRGDEGKALDLFFSECDLYRSLQPTDCHCAELTEKHMQHIEKHGARRSDTGIPVHRGVKRVCDLEMSDGIVHVVFVEYEDGERRMEPMLFFRDEASLRERAARLFGPDLVWTRLPVQNLLDGIN